MESRAKDPRSTTRLAARRFSGYWRWPNPRFFRSVVLRRFSSFRAAEMYLLDDVGGVCERGDWDMQASRRSWLERYLPTRLEAEAVARHRGGERKGYASAGRPQAIRLELKWTLAKRGQDIGAESPDMDRRCELWRRTNRRNIKASTLSWTRGARTRGEIQIECDAQLGCMASTARRPPI